MPPNTANSVGEFLRDAIGHYSSRLDDACKGVPEVEAVHAVRVSCRRLRSLLSLFRDYLPPHALDIRNRLRDLGAAFSPVRDLDVLLIHVDGWRSELGKRESAALKPAISRLAGRRDELVGASAAALENWRASREHTMLAGLSAPGGKWPTLSRRGIDSVAPVLLQAAHGRLMKAFERARRRATLERYHKLRIRGKKLRYALQALSGHYGAPAKPRLKALVAIQDGFGEYLDATRAAEVLGELALETDLSKSTQQALAKVVGLCRTHAQSELAAMPALLKALDDRRWADAFTARKKRKGNAK